MSGLLDELDGAFGTVPDGKTSVLLLARWHGAVTEHLAVTFVVVAEQTGREVIAAAVPLAEL
jgi:hypothetical protein